MKIRRWGEVEWHIEEVPVESEETEEGEKGPRENQG
jgi:hypothetical protein